MRRAGQRRNAAAVAQEQPNAKIIATRVLIYSRPSESELREAPVTLEYRDDYLIAGKATDAITPHFKVREFVTADGLYVHRELVGALQELREAVGAPIAIRSLVPRGARGQGKRGAFAFVGGTDPESMLTAAQSLVKPGFLAQVERIGTELYVEIPDPAHPAPLAAANALKRAVRVTAAYETSGDPYQQVTGNFDGAGLSFGPLQVNFRSGTLSEVFKRCQVEDEPALRVCFGPDAHWTEWQRILRAPRAQQLQWADALSVGARRANLAAPWRGYLQAVGRVETFRRVMLRYAYDVYGRKLIVALSWLKGLWPGRIDNFACLSALYDLCVQQGSLDKAHAAIRARVQREQPDTQLKLVHIAVEERGRTADPAWRADCISRRLGLLYREPRPVREAGVSARRENLRVYLVRNVPVRGAEQYLT